MNTKGLSKTSNLPNRMGATPKLRFRLRFGPQGSRDTRQGNNQNLGAGTEYAQMETQVCGWSLHKKGEDRL
jgi:hypothetical protein